MLNTNSGLVGINANRLTHGPSRLALYERRSCGASTVNFLHLLQISLLLFVGGFQESPVELVLPVMRDPQDPEVPLDLLEQLESQAL